MTIGARVVLGIADVYRDLLGLIEQEPSNPSDREILHLSFHVENTKSTQKRQDRLDPEATIAVQDLQRAITERAAQGWRYRLVVCGGSGERIDELARVVERVEGPGVHIKAYPFEVLLVLSPVIVAKKSVVLAYDDLSSGRPAASVVLTSPKVVQWATGYFAELFDDAPLKLRTPRGIESQNVASFLDANRQQRT